MSPSFLKKGKAREIHIYRRIFITFFKILLGILSICTSAAYQRQEHVLKAENNRVVRLSGKCLIRTGDCCVAACCATIVEAYFFRRRGSFLYKQQN
jgi:hypothetical protein